MYKYNPPSKKKAGALGKVIDFIMVAMCVVNSHSFKPNPNATLGYCFPPRKRVTMPIFTLSHGGSLAGLSFLSQHQLFSTADTFSANSQAVNPPLLSHLRNTHKLRHSLLTVRAGDSKGSPAAAAATSEAVLEADSPDAAKLARRSADWKAAREFKERGAIHVGRIEGSNAGGLLVRFHSLMGFLPYPQLSPAHYCKEPHKTIHEIAEGMANALIRVKIIAADEGNRNLVFSEREAAWTMFSKGVTVGDVFAGRVGLVEDYGAFVHLRFPDGLHHLTGLIHVSEVSWDLVRDVRDVLTEGQEVRVKVTEVDWKKSRIALSIKQLEEDPLLETLDKVIPQDDGSVDTDPSGTYNGVTIEPLPGLTEIFTELLLEEGIEDIRINRQGFEKRVVSQDLQLWLSNALPIDRKFILLARAGRQVQEIQLTTTLDQEGIKKALQHVLERVP
ncbi:unnamed protein product [Linum tenue]|uniref:S1 motif domain-containing protein n=1 Tax=Linum tenue TaxID=586396 RepID=A0AAV0IN02_9ROSI|nr:unnamed protein product [Linum tenue]